MDQKELLAIARASLKKRGKPNQGRSQGAARALVRDPDPPATSSRTSNIDSALARIAALDQELEVISQVQGAEESIFEAQERATASSSVRAAEQAILDMDTHIQEAHSFQEYPSVKPGTKQVPTPSRTSMRAAFRMSLVFGPPKAME